MTTLTLRGMQRNDVGESSRPIGIRYERIEMIYYIHVYYNVYQ